MKSFPELAAMSLQELKAERSRLLDEIAKAKEDRERRAVLADIRELQIELVRMQGDTCGAEL